MSTVAALALADFAVMALGAVLLVAGYAWLHRGDPPAAEPAPLAHSPEQLARAEGMRAEIKRLAQTIPSAADVKAYQASYDGEFRQIVDEQFGDVEDLAHRFYDLEEAS